MTRYYYTCEQDRQLIERSFDNIALIIFGKNNYRGITAFKGHFENRVSQINVFPQGTVTEHLNNTTPGRCALKPDGSLIIEMLGYNGASADRRSWIKHEGTHEACHAFVDILPEKMAKNPDGIVRDGIRYKNHMGMIEQRDTRTGKLVGQHYYGKMYNETSMDIITSMAINCFDPEGPAANVDQILQTQFKDWGNQKTSYSIFTSITRLTIAAFSNNGTTSYQSVVDKGLSIFFGGTRMKNGEIYRLNDFLYGIVYDPLHIEEEFDKIMGIGSYRAFCEYQDRLFIQCLNNQIIPSEEIKRIMNILPDFLNKRMAYYKQKGIIDTDGANRIIENFNKIWNSMQSEYRAFFSEEDIGEIARRAGKL